MDVGQLMLLSSDEKEYLALLTNNDTDQSLLAAEQQQFATTHSSLSGELIDSWEIGGALAYLALAGEILRRDTGETPMNLGAA